MKLRHLPLLLCALLGACEPQHRHLVEAYLGPSSACAEGATDTFLCHQQDGDETFTVLCIYDRGLTICANFPSCDPPHWKKDDAR